eukprot:5689416-Prymnesium_polylepis.1
MLMVVGRWPRLVRPDSRRSPPPHSAVFAGWGHAGGWGRCAFSDSSPCCTSVLPFPRAARPVSQNSYAGYRFEVFTAS